MEKKDWRKKIQDALPKSRVFTDDKGGRVVIGEARDKDTVRFIDDKGLFTVDASTQMLKVNKKEDLGKGRDQKMILEANSSLLWCYKNSDPSRTWSFSKVLHVSATVVEDFTRGQILSFIAEHPQIGKQLREANIPITVMDGKPVTLADLEKVPSHWRACPEDNPTKLMDERPR